MTVFNDRTACTLQRCQVSRVRSARFAMHALVWLSLLLAGCVPEEQRALTFEGGCKPSHSQWLSPDNAPAAGRISYCDSGDDWTGQIRSSEVPAGTSLLKLRYAGYPQGADITIYLEGAGGHRTITLPDVHEIWSPVTVRIPDDIRAHPFWIVLDDREKGMGGWAGIGAESRVLASNVLTGALKMALPLLLLHAWCATLTAILPASAGAAPRRALLTIVLLGCAGALTFAAWWTAWITGVAASLALTILPFTLYFSARYRNRVVSNWRACSRIFVPVTLAAALILWIGLYPFEWNGRSWETPANRWSSLPMDNWLPLMFAQMLQSQALISPMAGEWLSSDRPPLQTGLYLMFSLLQVTRDGLWYQALATWLQCLVLVPLGYLLARWITDHRDRGLALLALIMSPLLLVNTLFVWPKLLAATFCLIYHMALLSPRMRQTPSGSMVAAAALSATLAMLAHGGALFVLVGSTLAALVMQPGSALRALVRIAPFSLLGYMPWVLYQRLVDPPGDRLAKWHFAGATELDPRPLTETIASAYTSLTPSTWWQGRVSNLSTISEGTFSFFRHLTELLPTLGDTATFNAAWNQMYASSFYHFAYALWFFGPAVAAAALIIVLLRGRRPDRGWFGMALATSFALTVWILVMFDPGSTIVHQGAYAASLFAAVAGILLAWQASALLFRLLAIAQVLLALTIYVFDRVPATVGWHALYVAGVLFLLSLLLAALLRQPGPIDSPHTPIEGDAS